MSLERRGRIWHFDFRVGGVRYRRTTGKTSKTLAKEFERAERDRISVGEGIEQPMTLAAASVEWFTNRGQFKRSSATLKHRLRGLEALVDFSADVREIDAPDVERAMAKRRGMTTHNNRLTTASTVNRDVIDTLRPILSYARKTLKVAGMPEIDWGHLRLPEPRNRVREFTTDEMAAIRAGLATVPHHLELFEFLSLYGVRLREAWFPLDQLDLSAGRVFLRQRKAGDWHSIPLGQEWTRRLATRVSRAQAAKIDTVWFWEDDGGQLHALSPYSFQSYMRKLLKKLKIKNARPAHDFRHHAATQAVRRSKNLKAAQKLLGHENIASTAIYAHASEDDVLDALGQTPVAQTSPQSSRKIG